jgi:tripartite-type tricarboxylate transporter receptor subunit TctC
MQITRLIRRGLVVMAFAGTAFAQAYPEKTLRIVTSGVGGAGDVASRLIAHGISPGLGRQVIVDNRASGTLPVETVIIELKTAVCGSVFFLPGNIALRTGTLT